jgi:hypothetical protein
LDDGTVDAFRAPQQPNEMNMQTTHTQSNDAQRLSEIERQRLIKELAVLELKAGATGRAIDQMVLAMTRSCLSSGRHVGRL